MDDELHSLIWTEQIMLAHDSTFYYFYHLLFHFIGV